MLQNVFQVSAVPDPRHAEYNFSVSGGTWIVVTDSPVNWVNNDPVYLYAIVPASDYPLYGIQVYSCPSGQAPYYLNGAWRCAPIGSGGTPTIPVGTPGTPGSNDKGTQGVFEDFMDWITAPDQNNPTAVAEWKRTHPNGKLAARIVPSIPNWVILGGFGGAIVFAKKGDK